MKLMNIAVLVAATVSLAIMTSAQETKPEANIIIVWPKLEIGADFSYLRLAATSPFTKGHSLRGGGGFLVYNWNEYLGLEGEVQVYTSNKAGFTIPPTPQFPSGLQGSAQGNMVTYLFGPQFKVRSHRVQPFAHLLVGGAHTNIYDLAIKPLCQPTGGSCTTSAPTANSFALDFGGGVDIPIVNAISLRPVQVDYVLTRFSNPFTGSNIQNNFHASAGIVLTLGRGGY